MSSLGGPTLKKINNNNNVERSFQFVLDWLLGIDFLYSNLIFACLNLVAVTVFLEMWKRRFKTF